MTASSFPNTHWTQVELLPNTISNYHHIRLVSYSKKLGISMDRAVAKLIELHQNGSNIAEHISGTIGESHDKYISKLIGMNESVIFIR